MDKINGCLKCVFIFINMLCLIAGCVLMVLVIFPLSDLVSLSGAPAVGWIWMTIIGMFILSCLGFFAGFSEKLLPLKIFAGFMLVGLIIVLIFGIIWVVSINKAKAGLQGGSQDVFQELLAKKELKEEFDIFQNRFQCCGWRSAEDWGETIPVSCECNNSSDCKPKPAGSSGPSMIYSKTCGETLFETADLVFKVVMGIYFGFSVTALFGLLFTLLMIRQVSRHDSAGGPSMVMKGY